MPFEALGEDVLLRIFCFCDISTVLAVSAINKGLRFIALSKQLWLSLVLDPRFRDALDLPPPNREKLECLSTEELITVVKDAVTGPCSIGDSEHDESSVILTSVQIPLDDMEYLPFVRLLPGARYLLLHSISTTQQRLCIYDFWSARCVWERLEQAHTMCEVDLVPGGAIARVCLVQPGHLPNTQKVHIEELGLTTGASHELFAVSFTGTIKFGTLCAIVGDFLLGTVLHSHSHFGEAQLVLLIDWRTSTFVSLGRMAPHNNVQLIPGYILSTYQETSTPPVHNLVLTALEAFSDRWQPLTANHILLAAQLEAGYAPGTIPIKNITHQERLEYNHQPLGLVSITATPDALHAGAYNISVHGPYFPERPPRPWTLLGRIGNLRTMTARRGKASPGPAQALLVYRFTPEQGQATSKLRLVSARCVADPHHTYWPTERAIATPSKNSISVVYRQRLQRTGADAA
ncbi:F-box domain-containing protein [Mycena sanguinolenta]|uniref:F-box domain-containing protein n=1 Tax=Mycena sanguinolenta TaxID=230812 RepID=A0A8H7CX46_9AGAR|nr:F-box domain-containing protein [Mycena sanguinolenta]